MKNMLSTNETNDTKNMFDFPFAGNISVQIISINHTQYTEFSFRMALRNDLPHPRLLSFDFITYKFEVQTE